MPVVVVREELNVMRNMLCFFFYHFIRRREKTFQ